jgi:DNA-directed RNA polymerase specialized sigma24 family protein
MDEREILAQRFEAHRAHLRAVAYRMLGSAEEAERVAFVLHDMFDLPFDDIAPIVGGMLVPTR